MSQVALYIKKNGLKINTFICEVIDFQDTFSEIYDITGQMYNGSDTFSVASEYVKCSPNIINANVKRLSSQVGNHKYSIKEKLEKVNELIELGVTLKVYKALLKVKANLMLATPSYDWCIKKLKQSIL